MRKAARLGWASVTIFALLFPSFAWGQYLPVPGPGPIAPAPDVSDSSFLAADTFEPPPLHNDVDAIIKGKQEAASVVGVAPGVLQLDPGASADASRAQPLGQFSAQQESQPLPGAPALSNNFNGIDDTGWHPPDPVLAAGPTTLVLSTNGSVTIRDKTGTLVASTSLETFFGSVRANGENAFDPRVVFDTGSNRFFLSAVGLKNNPNCTTGSCVSHFFLAVSKAANPTTIGFNDWFFYTFDGTLDGAAPTANWADHDGLGVDGSVVVLTANMFTFSNNQFQRAKIRILNKAALISGGDVTWIDFSGMTDPGSGFPSFTLQPALTFGSPGTFFLASASQTSGSCDLVVWGIQNPLSSPTLTSLAATANGTCPVPPNALQSGGGTPLDTGDKRLNNAVYRNGSLWTTHSIQTNFGNPGSVNVSVIRWVQINLANWPNSVSRTQDNIFGADGFSYFYPVIMVDASNTLAIVFARSGASEFASARYTGRLGTDAANALQPSALLKAGTFNYTNLDSLKRNRWGDYYGIGLDPSDGGFWFLGEYAAAPSEWGTWVARLEFTSPTTDFVTRLYQQVLNRAPDPAGLQAFGDQIAQFSSVVPTVLAFFHSPEFLGRNTSNQQFLTILYHTFLNRDPDQAGFNAFLSDLTSGLRTRDNLLDIFLDSAEFKALASFLPPQDAVTAFVINLYVRILGRGPDQAGLQGFVAQLQATRTVLPTVLNFLHSLEFLNRNTSNTEYVTVLYRVFLNRVPDPVGLTSWVLVLSGGTTRDQLAAQFAASAEFQAIQHLLFP